MNTARQSSFQPRANLRRTLSYRPVIKIPYYGSLLLQVLYVAFFSSDIYSNMQQGASFSEAFDGVPWVALAVWVGLNESVIRPLMRTLVHVHQTGITLERGKKKIEIPFANMSRLTLPNEIFAKALLPGFFTVKMASGEMFYFTIALERSEYLLETIASNRPDIVQLEKLAQLRVQALVMDHGWARQKDLFVKTPFQLVFKYLLVPVLEAGAVLFLYRQHNDVNPYFVSTCLYFTVAAFGIGLPVYSIKAFIIATKEKNRLLKQPQAVIRDMAFEKKVNWIAEVAFWSLAVAYFIYFVSAKVL